MKKCSLILTLVFVCNQLQAQLSLSTDLTISSTAATANDYREFCIRFEQIGGFVYLIDSFSFPCPINDTFYHTTWSTSVTNFDVKVRNIENEYNAQLCTTYPYTNYPISVMTLKLMPVDSILSTATIQYMNKTYTITNTAGNINYWPMAKELSNYTTNCPIFDPYPCNPAVEVINDTLIIKIPSHVSQICPLQMPSYYSGTDSLYVYPNMVYPVMESCPIAESACCYTIKVADTSSYTDTFRVFANGQWITTYKSPTAPYGIGYEASFNLPINNIELNAFRNKEKVQINWKFSGTLETDIEYRLIRRNKENEYLILKSGYLTDKDINSSFSFLDENLLASEYWVVLYHVDEIIKQSNIININEWNEKNEILLYPNPANNYLHIESNLYSQVQIQILDLSGKLLKKEWLNLPVKLNLSNFSKGIYYYKFQDENLLELQNGIIHLD